MASTNLYKPNATTVYRSTVVPKVRCLGHDHHSDHNDSRSDSDWDNDDDDKYCYYWQRSRKFSNAAAEILELWWI